MAGKLRPCPTRGHTGKPARPPVTGERQGVTAGPGALGEQVGEPSAMWQYSAAECGPPSPLKTPSPWRPGPQPTTPLATAWQKLWRQTLEPVPWCGTCLWAAGHAAHGCAGHLALSASSLLRAGSMCPARSGAALGPEDCWLAVSPEPGSRPPGRHVGHKRRTAPCPAEGPGSLRGQDTPGQREKHQVRVEEGDPALAWPGRQLPSPPPPSPRPPFASAVRGPPLSRSHPTRGPQSEVCPQTTLRPSLEGRSRASQGLWTRGRTPLSQALGTDRLLAHSRCSVSVCEQGGSGRALWAGAGLGEDHTEPGSSPQTGTDHRQQAHGTGEHRPAPAGAPPSLGTPLPLPRTRPPTLVAGPQASVGPAAPEGRLRPSRDLR